jgi:hypothetical protein
MCPTCLAWRFNENNNRGDRLGLEQGIVETVMISQSSSNWCTWQISFVLTASPRKKADFRSILWQRAIWHLVGELKQQISISKRKSTNHFSRSKSNEKWVQCIEQSMLAWRLDWKKIFMRLMYMQLYLSYFFFVSSI